MIFSITEGHPGTEAEVIAEFTSMGLYPMTYDVVARSEDWHWHEFGPPYRVVFGFDRNPAEFTQPIDKPVEAGT